MESKELIKQKAVQMILDGFCYAIKQPRSVTKVLTKISREDTFKKILKLNKMSNISKTILQEIEDIKANIKWNDLKLAIETVGRVTKTDYEVTKINTLILGYMEQVTLKSLNQANNLCTSGGFDQPQTTRLQKQIDILSFRAQAIRNLLEHELHTETNFKFHGKRGFSLVIGANCKIYSKKNSTMPIISSRL